MQEGIKQMKKDLMEAEKSNPDELNNAKRYQLYDLINIKESHLDRFIIGAIFLLGMVILLGVIL